MSRTLHQIPTEVFRVRITTRTHSGIERTVDLGPYLSLSTAKSCVTREVQFYTKLYGNGSAEIFRYSLPGEWEVVKA